MDEALDLAAQGRGNTSPNPLVGAVVRSRTGQIVGRGFHERAGRPHAESRALDAAGPAAAGGTLYCNLEPCNHTGRTGPCTDRIIAAGVKRVVVGVVDPDPRVGGTGIDCLRRHGITVKLGVRRTKAARLNEAFITRVTRGRPFLVMKVAVSRDGKIASRPGVRTTLTSESANRAVQTWRAECDAIGVGSNTIVVDDPLLTIRGVRREAPVTRVIFDRRLRTPATARIFGTMAAGPVVIVTTEENVRAHGAAADALRRRGAHLEPAPDASMGAGLTRLATRGVTSLLLEGGVTVHRAAWRAGVVDKVLRVEAPVTLGERGVDWIDDEVPMDDLLDRRDVVYGPDMLKEGYVQRVD